MTIVLGLCFSVAIGISDFFGGYAARRISAITAVITGLAVSAVLTLAATTVVDGALTARDLGLGAASGAALAAALVFLYHGMAVSSAAVVSPIVAVLMVLVPVVYDVATGASLAGLVVAGTIVGIAGLALTTVSPELGDRVRIGAIWAAGSGICFGVALTFLGQSSADSGLWSALGQRGVGCVVLLAVATIGGQPRTVPRSMLGIRRVAMLNGAFGGLGMIAFVTGAQRGSLTEIVIASSMFPAVTAILSAIFDGHPLRWWQLVGIGGCITGVALIGIA